MNIKKITHRIKSHQGLVHLRPNQKNPLAAMVVGLFFMTISAFLLWSMRANEIVNEAPGLLKYFGGTYLYFSLLGIGGLFLFLFGIFRLIYTKGTRPF